MPRFHQMPTSATIIKSKAAEHLITHFFQLILPCARRSTLLKAMGDGIVVGFPSNLRVVYVDQLQTIQNAGAALSLVQSVMASDKEVLGFWRHYRLLQVLSLFLSQTLSHLETV